MAEDFQEFERLKQEMSNVSNIVRRYGADSKQASAAIRQLNNDVSRASGSLKALGSTISSLSSSVGGLASGMARGNTAFSSFSGLLTSGAKAISTFTERFGVVGKTIGTATKVIGEGVGVALEQYDSVLKVYQQISQAGLSGVNGIDELRDNMIKANMPLEMFGAALLRNGKALTALTGSADQSAKEFSEMMGTMYDGVDTPLRNLGFTTEEISDTLVDYADLQRRLGTLQTMDQAGLTRGTVAYGKELDKIAKLTGQSRKESQKVLEASMREGRYLAAKNKLASQGASGVKAASELDKLMLSVNALSPALASAVKDVSGGFISTDVARQGFLSTGGELTKVVEGVKNGSIDANEGMLMLRAGLKRTLPTVESINLAVGDSTGAFLPLHEIINATTFALSGLEAAIANNQKTQDKQVNAPNKTTEYLQQASKKLQSISAHLTGAIVSFETIAKNMEGFIDTLQDLTKSGYLKVTEDESSLDQSNQSYIKSKKELATLFKEKQQLEMDIALADKAKALKAAGLNPLPGIAIPDANTDKKNRLRLAQLTGEDLPKLTEQSRKELHSMLEADRKKIAGGITLAKGRMSGYKEGSKVEVRETKLIAELQLKLDAIVHLLAVNNSSLTDAIMTFPDLIKDDSSPVLSKIGTQLESIGGQLGLGVPTSISELDRGERTNLEEEIRTLAKEMKKPEGERNKDTIDYLASKLTDKLDAFTHEFDMPNMQKTFNQLTKQNELTSATITDYMRSKLVPGDWQGTKADFFKRNQGNLDVDLEEIVNRLRGRDIDPNRVLSDVEITEFKKVWKGSNQNLQDDKTWDKLDEYFNKLKVNKFDSISGPGLQFNKFIPGVDILPVKDANTEKMQQEFSANSQKQLDALTLVATKLDAVQTAIKAGDKTRSSIAQSARNA
jgi:hypothetical protein